MSNLTRAMMMGAAGAAGADSIQHVDDVFNTFMWEGTGTTKTIPTGINLSASGDGGLVWIKRRRSGTSNNVLFDTVRGVEKVLFSDLDLQSSDFANSLTEFSNSGFTVVSNSSVNSNTMDNVSWSFRKAPGFFDCFEYTGDGGNSQLINHSLGCNPGMVIVKRTDASSDWGVYMKNGDNNSEIGTGFLNNDGGFTTSGIAFTANSTSIRIYSSSWSTFDANVQNGKYIVYIFAQGGADSAAAKFGPNEDEKIIKTGVITSNGSSHGAEDIGFEPQWIMIKKTNSGDDWFIFDTMRYFGIKGADNQRLKTNGNNAEADYPYFYLRSDGFGWDGASLGSHSYFYMAIRRSTKPPTAGTDVFQSLTYTGSQGDITRSTNILVDLLFTERTSGGNPYAIDRMRGPEEYIGTDSTSGAGQQDTGFQFFGNNFIELGNGAIANSSNDYLLSMFRRAPGFLDVVSWIGNASGNRAIPHALGVTPELLILKRVENSDAWWSQYTGIFGTNSAIRLNSAGFLSTGVSAFNSTSAATASNFYVGSDSSANGNNEKYISYLFATLAGVSKVGTYSGTGNAINIPCGFTNGARFVLIKRTDADGDWYIWDSVRGISNGNDPYILLNNAAAQVTNTDYIDPLSSGFTVTSSAPASINANGGNYLFLAIA